MNLTSSTTLAGFGVAAGLAWTLGGATGSGVLAGYCAGAAVAGACVILQRRVASEKPQYLVHAVLAGFLIKAFAMLGLTLCVRFVPALAEACDALSFLLAFAVTSIGILVPATFDTLRALRAKSAAADETRVALHAELHPSRATR